MGIPSYFKKILQRFPAVLSKTKPDRIKALCFDFNCLVYRCLRSPTLRPFPENAIGEERDTWEKDLLHEVEKCVKEIVQEVGNPPQVFIAVDGVVPMAKIRQQRVRRFKSAWLRGDTHGWDSNAITPGTAFMNKLAYKLNDIAKNHKGWSVSDVNEHGEGEHKILTWLRTNNLKQKGNVIVYGLDADLILLTMLAGEELNLPIYLLREQQEFGGALKQEDGKQEYVYMNIKEFQDKLGVKGEYNVLNYIGLMSLMGNDFLPHSITHKLNDNGHDYVIRELRKGVQVVNKDGTMNQEGFIQVMKSWSGDEEEKLLKMIQKKQDQAKRGVLEGMDEREGLPLKWNVESALLAADGTLIQDWKTVYWNWIGGREQCKRVCTEYVRGFQWILDYYSGKPVNKHWMFPCWIPPLWSDLASFTDWGEQVKLPLTNVPEPTPEEQLAMVLPLESWDLIRSPHHKKLPALAPQFWPVGFSFFSAGRKWLWECEALVPPLNAVRLREILKKAKQ
jgi:5'-3' exonuclease